MENVLLDRSSASFEFPKRGVNGGGGGARSCRRYHHVQKGGAAVLPYARPPIYSSPSLPLLPSNQPPLLPLPPAAVKYATFPYPLPPPPRNGRLAATIFVPAAVTVPYSRQRDGRRKPPPSTERAPSKQKKKKPLERATPLPSAQMVTDALDDLEQEVTRSFVQDLLHALAPPPSSLPLPRFSLVMKASPSAPAAPSCNAEGATSSSASNNLPAGDRRYYYDLLAGKFNTY